MENLQDSFELDVFQNPFQHQYFMHSCRFLDIEVTVSKGKYIIEYDKPSDLYNLGLRMAGYRDEEFRSNGYASPNPYKKNGK